MQQQRSRQRSTRWSIRARASVMLTGVLLLLGGGAATAAAQKESGTSSMLDMFGVVTTDGTPLSQWEVPLVPNEVFGKDLPDPFLTFVDIGWYLYRVFTGFTLWILGQAQSGSWRAGLFGIINDTISPLFRQIHELHVPTLIATFAFVVVAWTWVRGRAGASLGEAAVVVLIHGLAVGVLASPVGKITEPGGAIDGTFRAASGITAELGEGQGGGTTRSEQRMADIMIGQPAQLMAFGELLTKECSSELTKALQKDATNRKEVREKVADCDKKYENQPSIAAIFGVGLFTGPFVASINVSTLMLAGLMIFLVLALVWYSIALAWNVIFATFPGRARVALIDSGIKVATSMAALVVCLVLAAVVSQMLVEIFDQVRGQDGGLINTFRAYTVASGIATLLWILLWWKALGALMRSKGKGKGLKDAANPARQPAQMPTSVTARAVRAATPAAAHAIGARLGTPDSPTPPNSSPAPTPGPTGPGPVTALTAGPSTGTASPTGTAPNASARLGAVLGTPGSYKHSAMRLASTAAIATMTGGTSLASGAVVRTAASIASQEGQRRLREQLTARTPTSASGTTPSSTRPSTPVAGAGRGASSTGAASSDAPHELPIAPAATSSGAGERAAAMASRQRAPHEIHPIDERHGPMTAPELGNDADAAEHARALPQASTHAPPGPSTSGAPVRPTSQQALAESVRLNGADLGQAVTRGAPGTAVPLSSTPPAAGVPATAAASPASAPAVDASASIAPTEAAKRLRERLYGSAATADTLGSHFSLDAGSYPDALSAEPVGMDL